MALWTDFIRAAGDNCFDNLCRVLGLRMLKLVAECNNPSIVGKFWMIRIDIGLLLERIARLSKHAL